MEPAQSVCRSCRVPSSSLGRDRYLVPFAAFAPEPAVLPQVHDVFAFPDVAERVVRWFYIAAVLPGSVLVEEWGTIAKTSAP